MIVVVGAGLAGLTCAIELAAAGKDVRVLEAADHIGGRVRTDASADGFLLDRGFQVLFTAYPAAQRQLNYKELAFRKFTPGAVLIKDGHWHELGDPFRKLSLLGPTLSNPLLPLGDKMRTLRLRRWVRRRSIEALFTRPLKGGDKALGGDLSAYASLRRRHFSEHGFIESFARPFFGGIFLDRELTTSARMFLFVYKMLASGQTVIPERGIGAITEQLAAKLPAQAIRLETRVEGIVEADGRAVGVTLTGGEEMQAEAVIIATDLPSAFRLLGQQPPSDGVPVTCVYFASTESLYSGPKLLLNANPDAYINNAVQISNVAPAVAPPGQHLISCTVLGQPNDDDKDLIRRCRDDLARLFPGRDLATLRHIATYRIPFAQFRQPPGIFRDLPHNVTPLAGLFLAGEYTECSSINGAILSGEKAAAAVLAELAREQQSGDD
jgi:phytoene dehydrogenase-like protein